MKKFFTIIALISTFIPAIQGTNINISADMQKKYDDLIARVTNTEVNRFTFDTSKMTPEQIVALRQSIVKAKIAISTELDAMGDKTKNWSKIIGGGVASLVGFTIACWYSAMFCNMLFGDEMRPEIVRDFGNTGPHFINWLKSNLVQNVSSPFWKSSIIGGVIGGVAASSLVLSHYGITYGPKTFQAGLNYKKHLQNILNNLDAMEAQIK